MSRDIPTQNEPLLLFQAEQLLCDCHASIRSDFCILQAAVSETAKAAVSCGGNVMESRKCSLVFKEKNSMATTMTSPKNPSTLANRDSFSLLRKEMDDLLSNFWGTTPTTWLSGYPSPAIDLSEQENAFVMKVDIPGLDSKDLNVQVHGNTVSVSGQRQEEKETKDKTFYRMERRQGSFSRSVNLPCNINEDEVAAEYVNGVLTLTLPKAESSQAKKITVKG
jgi:HSP20 family protein